MSNRSHSSQPKSRSRRNKSKQGKGSGGRAENDKQPINRLPPELLFRIFAVGDEEQRSKRLWNTRYSGFQDLTIASFLYDQGH